MGFVVTAAVVGGAVGLAKLGMSLGGRKKRIAEQKAAKKEMEASKKAYAALDVSNTFKNMENKMEDLTINQKGAQFEAEKGAQSRANTMQSLQGAAGGSGIAALAQQMANSGQLAAQEASDKIATQEAANQKAASKEAASLQMKEREGEAVAQQRQMDKTGTLLGMAQQRTGAANQARADAKAAQMGAIGDIGGAVVGGLTGGVGGGKTED